eukprot:4005750-Pyramimonas_sp.AAC.1
MAAGFPRDLSCPVWGDSLTLPAPPSSERLLKSGERRFLSWVVRPAGLGPLPGEPKVLIVTVPLRRRQRGVPRGRQRVVK